MLNRISLGKVLGSYERMTNIAKKEQDMFKTNSRSKNVRLHWFHWLIIGLSLIATLCAWYITKQQVVEKQQLKFTRESEQVISLVKERMQRYGDALWSGAAYIAAVNNQFSHKDWAVYSKNLSIEQKYPGINGIGVIYSMPSAKLKQFEKEQRKIRSTFKVYPKHTQEISLPIVHIEPLAINQAALGLDMAHEVNRFTAVQKAKITGKAQITGPIILVQDQEKTPGFLFFVPFYRTNIQVDLHKKVKKTFLGLVYAPFIVKKLMNGVLEKKNRLVMMKITDGRETIYDEFIPKTAGSDNTKSKYVMSVNEQMYGRTWTFDIKATPKFDALTANNQPIIILITGIVIDSLLLFLFIILARSNRKAVSYAEEVTREIKEKTKALKTLAHYDSLTNLPNRMSFLDMLSRTLARAQRTDATFAVCFIDIDDFKQVNDNLGHQIGDELLIKLPKLLLPIMRDTDYLSRLGGDEFGLIIENAENIDTLHLLLRRYLQTINQPIILGKYEINISISIGIALYPHGGKTRDELIANADIAMYRAKELGKNTFAFFSNHMNKLVKRRHAIDTAMRHALEKNEFHLVYQPQIEIASNQLIGVEALLRWHNPKLGNLAPDEFITLAEANGLIIDIGRWVLTEACKDLVTLKENNSLPHIKLAVNVSVREFEQQNYSQSIQKILAAQNIVPHDIFLEITESLLMENFEKIKNSMDTIKNLGAHFSLDDFGTGYSSMQYLKMLSLSILKIDKAFVRDITTDKDDAMIVKATIQLAHGLGLKVIAEGVETKEQLIYLQQHECDQVQGYYFAKPMKLDALVNWYENRHL